VPFNQHIINIAVSKSCMHLPHCSLKLLLYKRNKCLVTIRIYIRFLQRSRIKTAFYKSNHLLWRKASKFFLIRKKARSDTCGSPPLSAVSFISETVSS